MEKTYQEKITTLLAEIATLKKKSDQISMFRLLLIIGLLVVVYQLFKLNEIVGGLSIIGGILGFYYLVKFHEKIDSEIDLKVSGVSQNHSQGPVLQCPASQVFLCHHLPQIARRSMEHRIYRTTVFTQRH